MMKIFLVALILVSVLLGLLPGTAQAVILVPCGRNVPGSEPCEFKHLVTLFIRVINYLISVAAVVAMYHILLAGFNLITSLGNPEKIETAKKTVANAIVGFGLIILAFVFINLVVNGIFGSPGAERQWWDPRCVYDLTFSNNGCQ